MEPAFLPSRTSCLSFHKKSKSQNIPSSLVPKVPSHWVGQVPSPKLFPVPTPNSHVTKMFPTPMPKFRVPSPKMSQVPSAKAPSHECWVPISKFHFPSPKGSKSQAPNLCYYDGIWFLGSNWDLHGEAKKEVRAYDIVVDGWGRKFGWKILGLDNKKLSEQKAFRWSPCTRHGTRESKAGFWLVCGKYILDIETNIAE